MSSVFEIDRRGFVLSLGAMTAAAALGSIGPAAAQGLPKLAAPVFVTSLGQSLDAFQVQLAVKRIGIAFEYDPVVAASGLGGAKTLFLTVGASLKGFGDAGITINDELARASQLIATAKGKGIFVTVLHTGGAERRDALSNQLIQLAAPQAQLLIIRNDSDGDGVFAGIASSKNIPVLKVETVAELRRPLQEMFVAGS
jgi:hypothetical protein